MLTRKIYLEQSSVIEKELKQIFGIKDKLIIFDIGSCEGLDAIKYARLFPNAQIYAFEPLPENLDFIKKNIQKYNIDNIQVVPLAISNQKGKATFYISDGHPEILPQSNQWDYGNKSSSLLPPDSNLKNYHPWLKFEQTIEVKTNTVENFCIEKNLSKIDFIHLDVQGAELQVLQSAKSYLSTVTAIWLEVEKVTLYEQQPLKDEIEKFIQNNNFIKIKDTCDNVSGDQLYIKNNKYINFQLRQLLFDFQNIFVKKSN